MTEPEASYEAPAIEERAEVGGPLIGVPTGSVLPPSPTWRRAVDADEESS